MNLQPKRDNGSQRFNTEIMEVSVVFMDGWQNCTCTHRQTDTHTHRPGSCDSWKVGIIDRQARTHARTHARAPELRNIYKKRNMNMFGHLKWSV